MSAKRDSSNEEKLTLDFVAPLAPSAVGDRVHALLTLLGEAGPLRPEKVVAGFKGRFDVDKVATDLLSNLETPMGKRMGAGATLWRQADDLEYNVHARTDRCHLTLRGEMLLAKFCSGEAAERLTQLVAKLASRLEPIFARFHSATDLQLVEPPLELRPHQFSPEKVDEIYWLNVWGPELVEGLGRDRVLSTPAYRVEELPYGGVFLQLRPTPCDYTTPETREAQARALAHVRPDLDEAAIRATLAERSRKLTPVVQAFDPDVAELLERMVAWKMQSDRPTETARLNMFHPPAVTELVAEPLRSQGNLAAAVERYGDHAEHLVALLRKDIPEIENDDPAALPQIDYHLWHFNFAEGGYERSDIEQQLVPALGAYVGELMVKRLGGSWVPRTKIDETQVVIGRTAYLPFLRARHALATRQGQLDHSMTQFFRVAARAATT